MTALYQKITPDRLSFALDTKKIEKPKKKLLNTKNTKKTRKHADRKI